MFDSFMAQWINSRVADPLLANIGMPPEQWYQCVALIKQYVNQCYGIPNGYYGNAIDWWTNTPQIILDKFDKFDTHDVTKGDIVPLKTVGHDDYTEPGHIVIATGNENTTQFEALEQNGQTGNGSGINGDAIRTRWITKSRIAGVIRFRPTAAAPTPPPGPKYTVIEEYPGGKQIQLNKQPTNLWGMNYDFQTMVNNPVETHNQGEIWTVTNKVHHEDGYDYYRRDGQVDGFNVADCDDYTPPPPPYVPPAAPVPVKLASTYQVLTTLMYFNTAVDAQMKTNGIGTINAGTYYQFAEQAPALQLGGTNMKPQYWINTKDNVKPEPIPEPVVTPDPIVDVPAPTTGSDWKSTYAPFYKTASGVQYSKGRKYIVKMSGTVDDLAGLAGFTMDLRKGQELSVYGTFVYDGVKYYRLRVASDKDFKFWFGVPISYNGKAVLTLPPTNWYERILHRGEELKSIFTEQDAQFIDSILPKWFNNKKK